MTTEYDIPRTGTKFGDRSFSVAGPREWNVLPVDISNITDLSSLNRVIKIHFFWFWHIRINIVLLFQTVLRSALLDNF